MAFPQDDYLQLDNIDSLLNTIDGLYQAGTILDFDGEVSAPNYPQTPVLGEAEVFSGSYTPEELAAAGFNDPQISEIQIGLEQGLPIEHYAKASYTWTQMREIRLGLHASVNTTIYENNLYTVDQMREIRMGLLHHVDASVYANLMLSVSDMHAIRMELAEASYRLHPSGYGYQFTDEDSGLMIRISDDCMKAYISVPLGFKKRFTPPGILKILKKYEINYGLLQKEIERFCNDLPAGLELQIAQGSGSSSSSNGYYDFYFNTSPMDTPTIKSDGSVDYSRIKIAETVKAGSVLAVYHPARIGETGFTISSIPIRESVGVDLPPLKGIGIIYDEATLTYTAQYDGNVSFQEDAYTLNVLKNFTLDGDATRVNGNIRYDGSIVIRGDVRNMACIYATGDIVVEGTVEGAELHAGQNIVLKKGVNAAGKGIIEANGKIMGSFFEAAILKASGSIEGSYFLNCKVETDDLLLAKGGKALIQGGNIIAAIGIEAHNIRCNPASKTSLMVGRTPSLTKRKQILAEKLTKTRQEIDKLNEGLLKLKRVLGEENLAKNALHQKTMIALNQKDAQYALLIQENEHLEEIIQRTALSYVKVSGMLQAGITVNINGSKKTIEKNKSRITLTNDNLFQEE